MGNNDIREIYHESVSGPGHQTSQDKIIMGHPLIKFAINTHDQSGHRMVNIVNGKL